jgi:rhamnosyl/mannosyltransferase
VATPNHISSSYFLPAVEHKCRVVHYGVDLRRFEPTETSLSLTQEIRSYYEDPFLLLFVGRLVYYKGVEYLIEAMREVRNAHLVIVGDGPLKGKLKQMSCRCAPNRITFLPPQDEARLVALYRACDLFVLPSIACSEQFGIVQLEAMACEKAVITTDLPTGVTYVNQDGVTGLVVPQRNASALASTINSLLGDESLRNKLGRKGRKRIEMEFTLENMIREITTIYEEFASSGSLKAEVTATHLAPMLR